MVLTFGQRTLRHGRVIASAITADDGSYKLESLAPGQYRVMVLGVDTDVAEVSQFRTF